MPGGRSATEARIRDLRRHGRFAARAVGHPAVLFASGNTCLATVHAELLGIAVNVGLVVGLVAARWWELHRDRAMGIPFVVLTAVNLLSAVSIEVNLAVPAVGTGSRIEEANALAAHLSAVSFVLWGVGHLMAGRQDRLGRGDGRRRVDPQMYYGVGDLAAVSAGGVFNPFSTPFVLVGLGRSLVRPRPVSAARTRLAHLIGRELTAARCYGIGFALGAVTSTDTPAFALAQVCWALAYFRFPRG